MRFVLSGETPLPAILQNIRRLSGAGVLADRSHQTPSLAFRRYNLIYGFNGSGKSTLARILASLQIGKRDPQLPTTAAFELELDDGKRLAWPDQLSGLERRVAVFNADFVAENLQWVSARANPIFFIGRDQAAAAAELNRLEGLIYDADRKKTKTAEASIATTQVFTAFKRLKASEISRQLRLDNRRYEAPKFAEDAARATKESQLTDAQLEGAVGLCRQDEALAALGEVEIDFVALTAVVTTAFRLADETAGSVTMKEIAEHPEMVPWLKRGHDYHTENGLLDCLYCGNSISPERGKTLEAALNARLAEFMCQIEAAFIDASYWCNKITEIGNGVSLPAEIDVTAGLRDTYRKANSWVRREARTLQSLLADARKLLEAKAKRPTERISSGRLPTLDELKRLSGALMSAINDLNLVIKGHNEEGAEFAKRRETARQSVRLHYGYIASSEFRKISSACEIANQELADANSEYITLIDQVAELRAKVREHGPAADTINNLIRSYLGHDDLAIYAVEEGYEIHRYGRRIEGSPSEGEKTAIALCYFISTLQAERRSLSELIVVIDDPISSLDTRAMNFSCALVKSRLEGVAQIFLLTHNQHFMNEFKKAWKSKWDPKKDDPTASLFYLDVKIPPNGQRASELIKMSRLLREYDFEYHFLFQHVLRFANEGEAYDYAYMMPNVLRRVLDVFLAFRCPGGTNMSVMLEQLRPKTTLEPESLTALERLTQLESHSDSLDDLLHLSPVTIEEAHRANVTLLRFMEEVDESHVAGLRRICR